MGTQIVGITGNRALTMSGIDVNVFSTMTQYNGGVELV